jgi:hypothetical protein
MHRRFIGPVQFTGEIPVRRPSYLGVQYSDTNEFMRQVMREHNLPDSLIHNLVGIKGELMYEPITSTQEHNRYNSLRESSHPYDNIDNKHRARELFNQADDWGEPYYRRLPYRQYQDVLIDTYDEDGSYFPAEERRVDRYPQPRMNLSVPRLNRRIVSKTPIGGRQPKRSLTHEELRSVRARYYR